MVLLSVKVLRILVWKPWILLKKRGAHILAEIIGYGASTTLITSHPADTGEGAIRAMKMAMRKAGIVRPILTILMLTVIHRD